MKIKLKQRCCIDSFPHDKGTIHEVTDAVGRSMIPKYAEEIRDETVTETAPAVVEAEPETAPAEDATPEVETAAIDASDETATMPTGMFRRGRKHRKHGGDD